MEKLSLDYLTHIFVLCTVEDFTHGAFMGFLCGMFVLFATQHIESESVETLHTSPNHWLFMRKISLGHARCTGDKSLDLACRSNILALSFLNI